MPSFPGGAIAREEDSPAEGLERNVREGEVLVVVEGEAVEIGHGSSREMNLKNHADNISRQLCPDVIRVIAIAGAFPLFDC